MNSNTYESIKKSTIQSVSEEKDPIASIVGAFNSVEISIDDDLADGIISYRFV